MNMSNFRDGGDDDRAGRIREQNKATATIVAVALIVGVRALNIFINGGYTTQPEYHSLWRGVAALAAFWGVVLLVTYRYSWTCVIGAVVITLSGYYLTVAPTVTGYNTKNGNVSRDLGATESNPRKSRDESYDDSPSEEENETKYNQNICREIVENRGDTFSNINQCTPAEIDAKKKIIENSFYDRHSELRNTR